MFGKWFPGSRGDPTVPSGDRTDGTETTIRGNENGLFEMWLSAVPVGGSPTGAGESPAPPIFKTPSQVVSRRTFHRFCPARPGGGQRTSDSTEKPWGGLASWRRKKHPLRRALLLN